MSAEICGKARLLHACQMQFAVTGTLAERTPRPLKIGSIPAQVTLGTMVGNSRSNCTNMAKIDAISEFLNHAAGYKYVSFDLFDTLIKRRYLTVYEIHQTAGMYAQALLGRHGARTPEEMASARYRNGAAIQATIQEPLVDMVWDRLLEDEEGIADPERRAELVRRIVHFEHSIELANLGLVDGAADLLRTLKAQGKTVTAISDMYFSHAQMEEILGRLGILEYFDHVYVSADHQLTKQTGDLFRRVLAELGIAPGQMLHVGDNTHSDIAMAIEVGLPCVHVEQHHLLELERSPYGRRERIEEEVADAVKAHLFSVLFDGLNRGIEHIYFLARDGFAIRDFLASWDSGLRDEFLPVPETSPLYLNRVLTCWANVDFASPEWLDQAVGMAFWLKEGKATAADIAHLLGLEQAPGDFGGGQLSAASDTARFAEACRRAGLEDAVRDAVIERRRAVERYLEGIGFFDREKVALVDVGYSGTVPRALSTLLKQAAAEGRDLSPPAMVLHLIATFEGYETNRGPALPLVEFADRAVFSFEALPDVLRGYSWIELFFKHPSLLPILGYVEADGKLLPDLRVGSAFPGETPAQRVRAFAGGRDEDIVFLWMAATGRFDALRDPLVARFADPDPETLAQMRDEIYELDPIAGTRRSAILEMPGAEVDEIVAAAREGDYWIAGSIAASRLAAASAWPAPQKKKWWDKLLGRRGREPLPADFDPAFYRAFYPDLRHFPDDSALRRHFENFGRKEQRLGSRDALDRRLTQQCGAIPADFSAAAYLAYNPDVARVIDSPERALDHFMRSGLREGRRYRPALGEMIEQFEQLRQDGRLQLDPAEAGRHRRGDSTFALFLQLHDLTVGPWIDQIVVPEFRAMHSAWAGPVSNRAECILALCEHGLDRTPAFSFTTPFDPDFYRGHHPRLAALPTAALYRHYLNQGSAEGLAPSEQAALHRAWGHCEYPACFDWQGWQATRPDLAGTSRLAVLQAFLEADDGDRARWIGGEGAISLLRVAADRAREAQRPAQARRFLEAAIEIGGDLGWAHHVLGDLANEAGEVGRAIAHYRKGAGSASPNRWSFINAASLLTGQGNYRGALAILEAGRDAWQESLPWRVSHAAAIDAWACDYTGRLALQPPGASDFTEADEIVAEVARRIPDPVQFVDSGEGLVIFTSRPVSELPQDVSLRGRVSVVSLATATEVLDPLLRHRDVIFHEPTFTHASLNALLTARALNKRTVLWLGDLDDWRGHELEQVLWGANGEQTSQLRLLRAGEMALLARWCDEAVTTMSGFTPKLRDLLAGRPVEELRPITSRQRGEARRRKVVLVGPVGNAREADVRNLAEALAAAGESDPLLDFIVDRRLGSLPALAALAGRRAWLDDNPVLPELVRLVSVVDAVVAPAEHAGMAFALWREAQARAIPVLVVPFGRAAISADATWGADVPVVEDGLADALLQAAASGQSWPLPAIPASGAASAPALHPARSARRRLLLANVWAPPQVIGGATRVLKDNLNYLIDHHSDEFEIAVFASDELNHRSGEFTLDTYRGVPVFRVATPQEPRVYWRPTNNQAAARFDEVLDRFQPDIVHFHCLQKLGVGLPEACQRRAIPHFITLHDAWWLSDYFFLSDANGLRVPVDEDFLAQPRPGEISAMDSALRAQRLRSALLGATGRLAVSAGFARVYAECGVPVDVVENGAPRLEPTFGRQRSATGPVELCHIGGLEPHKGAFLVEAALRAGNFPNLRYTVVDLAQGADYVFHTSWGATPVTVIGRMGHDELSDFYARVDVLLAPSTCEESYGLVTREALAHGLWVVAGDRGGMAEPVREGINGFVVPVTDASRIAAVLGEMDADPARFRQSPPAPSVWRTADDQSRELATLYRSVLSGAVCCEDVT
jgi:HAD superfamily hydrolase (TIGR01549 family)